MHSEQVYLCWNNFKKFKIYCQKMANVAFIQFSVTTKGISAPCPQCPASQIFSSKEKNLIPFSFRPICWISPLLIKFCKGKTTGKGNFATVCSSARQDYKLAQNSIKNSPRDFYEDAGHIPQCLSLKIEKKVLSTTVHNNGTAKKSSITQHKRSFTSRKSFKTFR